MATEGHEGKTGRSPHDPPAMSRAWAMPSPRTFGVRPIRMFVERWLAASPRPVADPFAGDCLLADWRNDVNPATPAEFHLDALDFLLALEARGVAPGCVLFDPPYSPRQAADCYEAAGLDARTLEAVRERRGSVWRRTKAWREERDAVARIQPPGGVTLSFGWDTVGMGRKRGYSLEEVLVVCHGACHNDTLCVAERRGLLSEAVGIRGRSALVADALDSQTEPLGQAR